MANDFTQYSAFQTLKELSLTPFDLTAPNALTPERILNYQTTQCGFTFLYATERVNEHTVKALKELACQANVHQKMVAMQQGETINLIEGYESERRSVLHTATRDLFDHRIESSKAKEATEKCKIELDKLRLFSEKMDVENRFTDLIMVAIGGSELGPHAVYLGLEYLLKTNRNVHFVANVDPDDVASLIGKLNLKNTLVVIVSKAGTTLETQTNEAFFRKEFKERGLTPANHFVCVTGKGSPMDNPDNYLECFYMYDWVGGRYSTTSMVGGVVLSFAFGFHVFLELLKGANAMDKNALKEDMQENLPLLGALLSIWNHNFLHLPTLAIIPYSKALSRLSAHIQQVEMESNGKRIDKRGESVTFDTGMVIWGEPGTNAQHSFFQLIHQGTQIIPLEFIAFKKSQNEEDFSFKETTSQQKLLSNVLAQMIALAQGEKNENPSKTFLGNRPSHILFAKQLDPFTMGALLAYYEHKVAFEGFIWGINSFDQEGVQLGKVLANKILDRFKPDHENKPAYPLADTIIHLINKL